MSILKNGEKLKCRHGAQTDLLFDNGVVEKIKAYRGPDDFGGDLEILMETKTKNSEIITLRGVVHLDQSKKFRTPISEYEGI